MLLLTSCHQQSLLMHEAYAYMDDVHSPASSALHIILYDSKYECCAYLRITMHDMLCSAS